jgi:hypothetical protein
VVLAILAGILIGIGSDRDTQSNTRLVGFPPRAPFSRFIVSLANLWLDSLDMQSSFGRLCILGGRLESVKIVKRLSCRADELIVYLLPRLIAGPLVLCAIPWLLFEQYRPGNQLPPRTNYFTVGIKQVRPLRYFCFQLIGTSDLIRAFPSSVQVYYAFRLCFRLKQTFIYLAAYFLLGDCLNTCGTWIPFLLRSISLCFAGAHLSLAFAVQ